MPNRDPISTHQPRIGALLGCALVFSGGCAIQAFPVDNPPEAREARPKGSVVIHFGDAAPTCEYQDVAVLSYDWARDGIMTSQGVALNGIRRRAAKLGASGIRGVELIPGADVSMGVGSGSGHASGGTVSATAVGYGVRATEFGARGVAYYCM